jgi:hypothetical protein
MKTFSAGGYLLSDSRLEVRLVYTGFLLLVLIGLGTLAAFQVGHIGPTPANIAAYYRGGERAGALTFAKTFRELIELTHFHAFIMGIVYLVLAHLLIATTAPPGVKQAAVVGGFVGLVGDMLGVWAIRYLSPGFAYTQIAFWLIEWASFVAFVFYPMREMWFRDVDDDIPPA